MAATAALSAPPSAISRPAARTRGSSPHRGEPVLAREIGAVRDLVRLSAGDVVLRSYPTVWAAVDELTKGGEDGPGDR
jgi:hypothetical protein